MTHACASYHMLMTHVLAAMYLMTHVLAAIFHMMHVLTMVYTCTTTYPIDDASIVQLLHVHMTPPNCQAIPLSSEIIFSPDQEVVSSILL